MLNTLQLYFSFPFVRNALIVGVFIAICAALLGTILVPKKMSFVSTGLSNLAFCLSTIAAILNLTNELWITLPGTVIASLWLFHMDRKGKGFNDSFIAIMSVGSMALGYLLMNLFSNSTNLSGDVCATLFGATSILTLSTVQVVSSIILTIAILILYIIFYRKIFAITFDETFVRSTKKHTNWYTNIIAIMIAVVIVLAMQLVGSLLISALIVFPVLSAINVSKSFKHMTILSVVFAVFASVVGILIAILYGTPVGSTIVVVNLAYYILSLIGRKVVK